MTVSELKLKLKQANLIVKQQFNMPNDQYSLTLHEHAIDVVSGIRYQLLNHPDLTVEDYDELFYDKYDIPYPDC